MKKMIKRMIKTVLALLLCTGIAEGLRYILIDDSSSYTRIMMHQMYTGENIDILFAGSSHVYRAIVPEIMDKEFGTHTFNAGTSLQVMDGTLTLIKEISSHHDLKHIYLELYYAMTSKERYRDRTSMTSTYIISDYMKPSLNRINYLLNASGNEHWINSFLIARRKWSSLFDFEYISKTIRNKQTEEYRNFEYIRPENSPEYYVDRGFVANDDIADKDAAFNAKAYGKICDTVSRDSDWYRCLQEIIQLCRKQNIPLTLFITPQPEWTLIGKEDYQEYHDFIADIAREADLEFYDFNLCRNEIFDTNDHTIFKDEDHVNTEGAKKFSRLAGQFFTGKITEDIFHTSFTEKVQLENDPYYGIAGPYKDKTGARHYRIITGTCGYEYQVTEKKENGEETILLPFGTERDFVIPRKDKGTLILTYRKAGTTEEITHEIPF